MRRPDEREEAEDDGGDAAEQHEPPVLGHGAEQRPGGETVERVGGWSWRFSFVVTIPCGGNLHVLAHGAGKPAQASRRLAAPTTMSAARRGGRGRCARAGRGRRWPCRRGSRSRAAPRPWRPGRLGHRPEREAVGAEVAEAADEAEPPVAAGVGEERAAAGEERPGDQRDGVEQEEPHGVGDGRAGEADAGAVDQRVGGDDAGVERARAACRCARRGRGRRRSCRRRRQEMSATPAQAAGARCSPRKATPKTATSAGARPRISG